MRRFESPTSTAADRHERGAYPLDLCPDTTISSPVSSGSTTAVAAAWSSNIAVVAIHFYSRRQAHRSRLKPVGENDHMRVLYWSHRDRWADAAPLGGIILPLDDALEFIAKEPVFWT